MLGEIDTSKTPTQEDSTVEVETTGHAEVPEIAPEPQKVFSLKSLLQHPMTHPIVLDLLMTKLFGAEWLGWEPETIEHLLGKSSQTISALNMSKLQACKALHLVDTFWQQWEVFNWCTQAFNGVFPDFEVLQVPTVLQTLVAVDIANRIRTDVHWSNEVVLFLDAVYKHDGLLVAIPPHDDFLHVHTDGFAFDYDVLLQKIEHMNASDDSVEAEQVKRYQHILSEFSHVQELLKKQLKSFETL